MERVFGEVDAGIKEMSFYKRSLTLAAQGQVINSKYTRRNKEDSSNASRICAEREYEAVAHEII